MDPLNRLLWWREARPRPCTTRAHQFHGWHELMTRYLCGRAVSDHGLAGKFFAYDLATPRLVAGAARGLGDRGAAAARRSSRSARLSASSLPDVAAALSLPAGVVVGTGSFDTSCGALGIGRLPWPACSGLVVGSWESFVAPIDAPLPARDVIDGRRSPSARTPAPAGSACSR